MADRFAEEAEIAVDFRLVEIRGAEMRLGIAVGPVELLVDAGARHVLVEAGRLEDQVIARRITNDLPAVRQWLAGNFSPDEFLVQKFAAFLEVHSVRHLADEVGRADQATEQAVPRVVHEDVVDLHLIAGEVHEARGRGRFGAEADSRQVRGDEIGAAADVHLGEHRAVLDGALRGAAQVAGIVEQGDQHAKDRTAGPEPVAGRAGAVVTVDEPRHRERHVERVAEVVIQRVAGEVARKAPFEQRFDIVEHPRQYRQINAGIAGDKERRDGVAHHRRTFHVHPVSDVVLVQTSLQGTPQTNYRRDNGIKGETACKPGSVHPGAGEPAWDWQPFLWAARRLAALATYPQAWPSRPEVTVKPPRLPIWCCSGWRLPRFTPWPPHSRASTALPRTRLCGPLRHVAVPGRYPASRSAEPGLSSVFCTA